MFDYNVREISKVDLCPKLKLVQNTTDITAENAYNIYVYILVQRCFMNTACISGVTSN